MDKVLTYEELIILAKENYNKGGDGVYECWGKSEFNEWVKEFGPITKKDALEMFRVEYEVWKDYQETIW